MQDFVLSSFGHKQTMTSFGIKSPRMQNRSEAYTFSQFGPIMDIQGMDDSNLIEPIPVAAATSVEKTEEPDLKAENMDLHDFEVADKGVLISGKDFHTRTFIPDLGKGLSCVVQTHNGGYLTAMNMLDVNVSRKDTPRLAMQISKPLVLVLSKVSFPSNGFELFQRIAGLSLEDLSTKLLAWMHLDDLIGKTTEQIAFEGIASTIIRVGTSHQLGGSIF